MSTDENEARNAPCPHCRVKALQPCRAPRGATVPAHKKRIRAARTPSPSGSMAMWFSNAIAETVRAYREWCDSPMAQAPLIQGTKKWRAA